MWADIVNHWQYLAVLFVSCLLMVLPIYININKLASSITGTVNQLIHLAYFYYALSTLWNGYFLYNVVNKYYLMLYVLWIVVFGFFNPFALLTTVFPMFYTFLMTLLCIILLFIFRKDLLTTLFIFLLTITSQMALYSFSSKPTFLLLAVMAVYLLAYYYFSKPIPVPTGVAGQSGNILSRVQPYLSRLYNLSMIEKSGLFLLVSGILLYLYIRDVTKGYYGGQFLVNDPISLNQITTFPIEATLHSSLSCWIYLDPTNDTEYNTVFLYGEKLLVSYEAGANSLRVRLKDDISFIERKIMLQKWNHLAFVYDHGRIIFYLNGDVIHSSEWSPDSFTNEILFGKVRGKLCHVRYYKQPLEERFIQSLYENFKEKNPPIV